MTRHGLFGIFFAAPLAKFLPKSPMVLPAGSVLKFTNIGGTRYYNKDILKELLQKNFITYASKSNLPS